MRVPSSFFSMWLDGRLDGGVFFWRCFAMSCSAGGGGSSGWEARLCFFPSFFSFPRCLCQEVAWKPSRRRARSIAFSCFFLRRSWRPPPSKLRREAEHNASKARLFPRFSIFPLAWQDKSHPYTWKEQGAVPANRPRFQCDGPRARWQHQGPQSRSQTAFGRSRP